MYPHAFILLLYAHITRRAQSDTLTIVCTCRHLLYLLLYVVLHSRFIHTRVPIYKGIVYPLVRPLVNFAEWYAWSQRIIFDRTSFGRMKTSKTLDGDRPTHNVHANIPLPCFRWIYTAFTNVHLHIIIIYICIAAPSYRTVISFRVLTADRPIGTDRDRCFLISGCQ